ncbi:MAG: hypothetical protein V4507_04060 [Verrucomicrobiota bacterium]
MNIFLSIFRNLSLFSLLLLGFSEAAPFSELQLKRAGELRELTKDLTEVGTYIYSRTVDAYAGKYDLMAEKVQILGITNVYLSFSLKKNEQDPLYSEKIRTILQELHKRKISVSVETLNDPETYTVKGYVESTFQTIRNFNESAVDSSSKFDAISLDVEPHTLKEGRSLPKEYPFRWNSETGNGPGKANDLLMIETFSILKRARKEAGSLKISEAVAAFFHERVEKGLLTVGKINDFLAEVDTVHVMSYFTTGEKIVESVDEELRAASREKSILVCVKTSLNTVNGGSNEASSLSVGGWDSAVAVMKQVITTLKPYPSFRGVGYFEFQGLVDLWESEAKK